MTTPDQVTITPGEWRPEEGPDPSKRVMTLAVTGAAPGVWEIGDGGGWGYYFHIRHNGHHVGMTHWNAWDTVRIWIAHESGPYTVTLTDTDGSRAVVTGNTLTEARLIDVRAPEGTAVKITNADGNEVRFPRRPAPEGA